MAIFFSTDPNKMNGKGSTVSSCRQARSQSRVFGGLFCLLKISFKLNKNLLMISVTMSFYPFTHSEQTEENTSKQHQILATSISEKSNLNQVKMKQDLFD